jgi:type II secretory ATPase GspE/PulE/Tfp pilus assembly ATPase PilB-like protein
MFEMTEELRELIVADHFSADAVRKLVRQSRMMSMVENARDLVAEGRTTFAEVIRVFGDTGS